MSFLLCRPPRIRTTAKGLSCSAANRRGPPRAKPTLLQWALRIELAVRTSAEHTGRPVSSSNVKDLANRTVVVTGASAGIGRAIALRFGDAGARVGLIARDADALSEVKEQIAKRGGTALVAPADVSDAQAVFNAADAIKTQLGPIEYWINDAMVTVFAPVWTITADEFRRVTEVTYLGAVHGTMAALRHMRKHNRGTIIQIGSALAYRGIPLQAAYCGAKHALHGFTDSLRTELIHSGSPIKISMVELPAVNTPQFDWARTHMRRRPRPVPPVVEPEVIANTVLRTALRPSREVWIGGSTIKAIVGNMFVPQFLDHYLAKFTFDQQETQVSVSPKRKDNLLTPVHGLHRTRGSFDHEAVATMIAVPGVWARLAPILVGSLFCFGFGFWAGRPHS
ncbi:MAG: SDR family oxidoreductase [Hyphomicrobiales bacterium]|nr:SDR family oxidoreductase [Hyphomicrobiales bacterium]